MPAKFLAGGYLTSLPTTLKSWLNFPKNAISISLVGFAVGSGSGEVNAVPPFNLVI